MKKIAEMTNEEFIYDLMTNGPYPHMQQIQAMVGIESFAYGILRGQVERPPENEHLNQEEWDLSAEYIRKQFIKRNKGI